MPGDELSPAAFLDRDGTLIAEKYYLADPDHVQFVPGALEALSRLRDAGYKLVIVTNQSGIARGLYTLEDYRAVEARIEEELTAAGIHLDGVFFCPHHPDFTGPCACRKPGLGMYLDAARNLGIDPARSVYIGDKVKDVMPALALKGRGILVRTGYGEGEMHELPAGLDSAADLLEAAYKVVGKTRTTP